MAHQHLTLSEREMITHLVAAGESLREIARTLARSPSTISRELRRNRQRIGVPLITVNWAKQNRDQWDTHAKNYPRLKNNLLPPFDRGLATFLKDLKDHGLLETTLVVCVGEFGRTPWINKDAGRDHWPDCYSVVAAGGGMKPGTVFGASSRHASYPTLYPVGPWDLGATMFHCLGIPPEQHIMNRRGQPIPLSPGRVIDGLLG
jgi:uncharacterized protein (DUF1501 family)